MSAIKAARAAAQAANMKAQASLSEAQAYSMSARENEATVYARKVKAKKEEMKAYFLDAINSANILKTKLEKLLMNDLTIDDDLIEKLTLDVNLAVTTSSEALNNVLGTTLEDAIKIDENIKCINTAFSKVLTETVQFVILKDCAGSLEEIWSKYLMDDMKNIINRVGPYAMGQKTVGQRYGPSATQGGRRKRNHKRTQRKQRKQRKHTHRNRK